MFFFVHKIHSEICDHRQSQCVHKVTQTNDGNGPLHKCVTSNCNKRRELH